MRIRTSIIRVHFDFNLFTNKKIDIQSYWIASSIDQPKNLVIYLKIDLTMHLSLFYLDNVSGWTCKQKVEWMSDLLICYC